MDDRADQMPAASVTVVNPASWATRAHQLAPLLAAAAGRPEGSRVVPDATGAPPTTTFLVADPAYWSTRASELAEALDIGATDNEAQPGGSAAGAGVGAAPTAHERLTLTVEEAASVLGISRAFAYEAVRRGEIPAIKIGRRILVPRAALQRLLTPGENELGSLA